MPCATLATWQSIAASEVFGVLRYRAFFESLTTKSELAGGCVRHAHTFTYSAAVASCVHCLHPQRQSAGCREALQAIGVQGNPHDRKPRFGVCQAQNADGGMNLSPVGTLMEVTVGLQSRNQRPGTGDGCRRLGLSGFPNYNVVVVVCKAGE